MKTKCSVVLNVRVSNVAEMPTISQVCDWVLREYKLTLERARDGDGTLVQVKSVFPVEEEA